MAKTNANSQQGPGPPSAQRSTRKRRIPLDVDPEAAERDRSLPAKLRRDARAGFPGLAISAFLHSLLLLGLALYFLPGNGGVILEPLLLGWAAEGAYEEPDPDDVFTPVQLTPIDPRPAEPIETVQEDEHILSSPATPVTPVDVSAALSHRLSGGGEGAGAANDEARQAVFRALRWLARQQQRDGRWRLHEGYPDAGRVQTDTGATALALLAFLGAGQTHQHGEFQSEVARGLDWLVSVQRLSGDLFDIEEQGRDAHFYAHAQATIALCEALALTGDELLRPAAENAVAFLVTAQNPVRGGWKYRPLDETGIGDLSVTGWALMALHTARMANIDVPPESFLLASGFLDSVQERPDDRAHYRYRPDWDATDEQRWSMTAEGLLCRQWLGWPRDEPALQSGAAFLTSSDNLVSWEAGRRNVYAWYYTAQTLHNLGGDGWRQWFARVQAEIVGHQAGDGSWHPTRPRGAFLEHADSAGRLYMTAMCVLILETPVRHAPIYGDTIENDP